VLLAEAGVWDPSADFAFAPAQANAAPLASEIAMAATIDSNRLDIGSPPFLSGTAHAVPER